MPEPDATLVNKPAIAPPLQLDPLPLVGGYEMIKVLGQGGMGKVYLALHLQQNRLVALKVVTSPSQHVEARFQQEILAIASLKHNHIAQIYENGQVEGRPYYSMEYLAGGTLSHRLKESVLTPPQAARVIIQLAQAMQYAHSQGILHRDLKPSNVLLERTTDGSIVPKIADFGLAKRMQEDAQLTQTGDLFGSPSYMSPEQASGISKLTPAADVYALGAILYECLTGRPPFLGTDPMQTMLMVLSDDPLPPRQMLPQLPRDLNTICMKCLEKLPKKRYESAEGLARDLERFLNGEPIQARPVGTMERLVKWARRKPWQAAALVLSVILVVGLVVGLLALQQAYQQTRKSSNEANSAFNLSRDTLTSILKRNTELLSNLPQAEQLTIASYQPAIELFQSLDALRPDDRATMDAYFETLFEYVIQQVLYYRFTDTHKTLAEIERLLKDKQLRFPNDYELQLYQVKYWIYCGWLARQEKRIESAHSFETLAHSHLQSLSPSHPDDIRILKLSIDLLTARLNDAYAEKRIKDIHEMHESVVSHRSAIAKLEPGMQSATLLLGAQKSLATFLLAIRKLDEAKSLYQTIEKSLGSLQLAQVDQLHQSAQIIMAQGDIARYQQNWSEAQQHYQKAGSDIKQLRQEYPLNAGYLYDTFSLQGKQIELQLDQGQIQQGSQQLKAFIQSVEKTLKEHPEYASIADLLKYYRDILQKLETSQKP